MGSLEEAGSGDQGRGSAARGIMLAVLLSAPAWLGLGAWIWRMTLAE